MKDRIRRRDGRVYTRRHSDGRTSEGILYPMQDGMPIPEGGELVDVSPPDDDGWQDVESLYKSDRATSDGPAQVATPAYRAGYDRIFGKKPSVGLA